MSHSRLSDQRISCFLRITGPAADVDRFFVANRSNSGNALTFEPLYPGLMDACDPGFTRVSPIELRYTFHTLGLEPLAWLSAAAKSYPTVELYLRCHDREWNYCSESTSFGDTVDSTRHTDGDIRFRELFDYLG